MIIIPTEVHYTEFHQNLSKHLNDVRISSLRPVNKIACNPYHTKIGNLKPHTMGLLAKLQLWGLVV
jgi:hypothetical protein